MSKRGTCNLTKQWLNEFFILPVSLRVREVGGRHFVEVSENIQAHHLLTADAEVACIMYFIAFGYLFSLSNWTCQFCHNSFGLFFLSSGRFFGVKKKVAGFFFFFSVDLLHFSVLFYLSPQPGNFGPSVLGHLCVCFSPLQHPVKSTNHVRYIYKGMLKVIGYAIKDEVILVYEMLKPLTIFHNICFHKLCKDHSSVCILRKKICTKITLQFSKTFKKCILNVEW